MVAIKSQQAQSFLSKPDASLRAILLFGPDAGLVNERARNLAARIAELEKPAGEIVQIDETDIETDADRLAVELLTVPMFGGSKIVRVTAGRRINAALLKPLIEGPPLPSALVVEAGNLRPDEGLRALFEKSKSAAAIGCYADEEASLDTLINDMVRAAGLAITPEARAELASRLGADRGLTRSEIDKLTLYARDATTISIEHVEAIVGDASAMTIDQIIAAAAAGNVSVALAEADRAVAAGESPQGIIAATQRHFQRLNRTRVEMDRGRSLDDILRQIRPPLPFRQRATFERECRLWSSAASTDGLRRIADTAKAARLNGALESLLLERLLIELAQLARSAARPPARSH